MGRAYRAEYMLHIDILTAEGNVNTALHLFRRRNLLDNIGIKQGLALAFRHEGMEFIIETDNITGAAPVCL